MSKTNLDRVKEELTIDDLVWILDLLYFQDKYCDEFCEVNKNYDADDSSTWDCKKEGLCKNCIKEWLQKEIDDDPISLYCANGVRVPIETPKEDSDNVNHPKH